MTTLIITTPPMAAAFFQGTLGQFTAYSALGSWIGQVSRRRLGGLMSLGRRLLTPIKGGINSIRLDRDPGNLNMQITMPTPLLAEDLVRLIQLPDQLAPEVSLAHKVRVEAV
ncbi:hypothetical protein GGR76_001744 [Xanthomonas translucens]|uniref:hypothetical protein n=1 Tax=Xanthomonas campestris TaxID=339 RepID=UPI0023EA288F|nr:hypothetical protein [Xanthomonas campestris]